MGSAVTARHNKTLNLVARLVAEVGGTCMLEPRDLAQHSLNGSIRPDAVITLASGRYMIDVSVINPTAKSYHGNIGSRGPNSRTASARARQAAVAVAAEAALVAAQAAAAADPLVAMAEAEANTNLVFQNTYRPAPPRNQQSSSSSSSSSSFSSSPSSSSSRSGSRSGGRTARTPPSSSPSHATSIGRNLPSPFTALREKQKFAMYGSLATTEGCIFMPVVFESYGGVGEYVHRFIAKLAAQYDGTEEEQQLWKQRAIRALSFALQQGNAYVYWLGSTRARVTASNNYHGSAVRAVRRDALATGLAARIASSSGTGRVGSGRGTHGDGYRSRVRSSHSAGLGCGLSIAAGSSSSGSSSGSSSETDNDDDDGETLPLSVFHF